MQEEESGKTSGKKKPSGKKKDGVQPSVTIGEAAFNRHSESIQDNNQRRIDFNGRKPFLDSPHKKT